MPTPLVHLYVSQQILERADGQVAAVLRRQAGDFMLGSIAPDAWWLGDLHRADAHILPIPIPDGASGVVVLLEKHPTLRNVRALRAPQAAFAAGYLTHLLLDEIWYHDVFNPYFFIGPADVPLPRRLLLHNVLRILLEDDLEDKVSPAHIQALSRLRIDYDLPPISDATLILWRDVISTELLPGGEKHSAEVFAERMGMPVEELLDVLNSPAQLEEDIFGRLPAELPNRVLSEAVHAGVDLLRIYLKGAPHEKMLPAIDRRLRASRHG